MPFAKNFVDVFELGIKAASAESGAYAERLDSQVFLENMLQRIYNQIVKADLIIADMTDKNPNVFYEVGYAHALGKKVILITKKDEDIPFDLKHYPFIIYENISELKEKLKKIIPFLLNTPKAIRKFPVNLSIIDLKQINFVLPNYTRSERYEGVIIFISVQNVSSITQNFQIGFTRTEKSKFDYLDFRKEGKQPHFQPNLKDLIVMCKKTFSLYPYSVDTIEIELNYDKSENSLKTNVVKDSFIARVFTENGYNDFDFDIVQDIIFD